MLGRTVRTVALHDLAAKFLQAALFDCLMPRLNFGVSAEVRLSCSCQENTEQLYDSIVLYMCIHILIYIYIYTHMYSTSIQYS